LNSGLGKISFSESCISRTNPSRPWAGSDGLRRGRRLQDFEAAKPHVINIVRRSARSTFVERLGIRTSEARIVTPTKQNFGDNVRAQVQLGHEETSENVISAAL
jgi:hypothetical protein